jgi:hypothetical protein
MTPSELRTNGSSRPIDVGPEGPLLRWRPDLAQVAAQVVVSDASGADVWDSGSISTSVPEFRCRELRSRTNYRWRVRIRQHNGQWSAWSGDGFFETPLLRPED